MTKEEKKGKTEQPKCFKINMLNKRNGSYSIQETELLPVLIGLINVNKGGP